MTSVVDAFKSSGGWNRTNGLLVQSQASLPTATAPDQSFIKTPTFTSQVRGEGIEPPLPGSKPGSLPLADPRSSVQLKCPAGVEPAWPAWKAGASAARPRARTSQGGRRGSRTLKAHRSTVFETAAIANWLALPYSRAAVAGIEPASGRLTARLPYQHRPHRNMYQSAWSDLNRRSPAPEAGGIPGFPTRRIIQKHPAGVEPARPPWQGSRLPLHHGQES